jgi:2-iminobutanoate/2-iminopropanoate deaminase
MSQRQKQENSTMNKLYSLMRKRGLILAGIITIYASGSAFAQNKAIDFKPGNPFSDAVVSGNTLYVAGQQGPDANGKVTGTDITTQTTNTIAAIKKIVEKSGFKMSDIVSVTVYITDLADVPAMNKVYIKDMPDPKPARATVKVAGLIGDAKIEISCIAVKH